MSLQLAIQPVAMVLIRNNQERLFTTKSDKVALSAGALFKRINLLKPIEHCL
jgi:hypothetical protein